MSLRFLLLVEGARIVGLGEGAHFVAEFSLARASLIRYLVERHDFNAIGLECGAIQASRLSEYLNSTAGAHELERFSDPLTFSLYGSVLIWIKSYLRESGRKLQLVGIDLPNTLNQGTTWHNWPKLSRSSITSLNRMLMS